MKLVTIKTVSYLTATVDTVDTEKAKEMALKGDYVGASNPSSTKEVVRVEDKKMK